MDPLPKTTSNEDRWLARSECGEIPPTMVSHPHPWATCGPRNRLLAPGSGLWRFWRTTCEGMDRNSRATSELKDRYRTPGSHREVSSKAEYLNMDTKCRAASHPEDHYMVPCPDRKVSSRAADLTMDTKFRAASHPEDRCMAPCPDQKASSRTAGLTMDPDLKVTQQLQDHQLALSPGRKMSSATACQTMNPNSKAASPAGNHPTPGAGNTMSSRMARDLHFKAAPLTPGSEGKISLTRMLSGAHQNMDTTLNTSTYPQDKYLAPTSGCLYPLTTSATT